MRITNRMISNNYMLKLNDSLEMLNQYNDKVISGRKYEKASEDPASALKAYKVRENLSRLSLYKNNIEEVSGMVSETESAVKQINTILSDVNEQMVKGKSDTMASTRGTIAEVIRNYQGQIYNIANTKTGGKYIFGGSDSKTMPFSIVSGDLLYHGTDVDDNNSFPDEAVYYDIGLGLSTDASGNVVPGTALNISNPGSKIFGTGKDGDGLSNNLYNLLGQIADAFENNDMTQIDKYMDKIQQKTDDNMLNYVNAGQRSNFIDFLKSRYDTEETNALTRQKSLEGVDSAKAIQDFNAQQVAYNAALKMGSKIIQMSLLDYMS